MKFLMLRGQVPQDRDPKEIVFYNIDDVDDVWTQLFFAMLTAEDEGELWYWGEKRYYKFTDNFTERWVTSFRTHIGNFVPDVIFCRGGFQEYHPVLKRYPDAIKIYYGAGKRFLPQPGFHDYDIILQDSHEQVKICKEKFPDALTTLYIKPAAENIFFPIESKKEYDVCFPANGAQTFKGHEFVYDTVPEDLKVLNLGNKPDRYKRPPNVDSKRVLRSDMAENISSCKVGIVAVSSDIDSCPRVIPEMLACGIPIIVRAGTRFWGDKYIKSASTLKPLEERIRLREIFPGNSYYATGEISTTDTFWNTVRYVLDNIDSYEPRKYYDEKLTLHKAAAFIKEKINEVSI